MDLPGQVFLDDGVLDQPVAAPLEAALAEGSAQRGEVVAALRRRRAGCTQGRPLRRGAVTVDALDLDGGPHLAVQLGVAVDVLREVAVGAVHPLLQVNIEEMNGDAAVVERWLRS